MSGLNSVVFCVAYFSSQFNSFSPSLFRRNGGGPQKVVKLTEVAKPEYSGLWAYVEAHAFAVGSLNPYNGVRNFCPKASGALTRASVNVLKRVYNPLERR